MNGKDKTDEAPFFKSIGACFMALKRYGSRLLSQKSFGFSLEQIIVLKILEDEEGLHLTQLAEKCERDKTTITRMINGLERRNLVVKVPSETDSRHKSIYLTRLGKEKIAELAPLAEKILKIAFGGIEPNHVKLVQDVLNRVTNNLEGNSTS
jgi:DNA-binding MarR family transcriptional regulator